jgi:cell wall-associated NlpC family hydrolase
MPRLNPPDVPGSPYAQNQAPVQNPSGVQAANVAKTLMNIPGVGPCPYYWGGNMPPPQGPGLDCSGLMIYCYNTGPGAPGLALGGRTVADFWNSGYNTIIVDQQVDNIATSADLQKKLMVGDLIVFGPPGISGSQGHVCMYVGGGQVIEETGPNGAPIVQQALYAPGGASSSDPFLGVLRPSGGPGAAGTGGDSGQGSGNAQSTTGAVWQQEAAAQQAIINTFPDPRDNLPFSKYFQTMHMQPGNKLVRGGIIDLTTKRFRCYFMMNPQQISMGSNIDTTNLTSPLQQDPTVLQNGSYWVTNQTVSFTVYFNRMYEVWQGNVPGPSDIGCRWDIRALERLIGIFDAQAKASVGVGNYGAGGYPPMTYPLQVVFGGANSYQFQGVISQFDYVYTLFDRNMIPIEAYADIGIMRIYQPDMSSPDLVNSLPMTAATAGQYLSSTQGATGPRSAATQQFNLKKGTGS